MAPTEINAARTNMVEGQIRPNKVTDPRIIDAFLAVPREAYVPKGMRGIAYVDEDIEVAPGRFLMEPMVLARLLQEARIEGDQMVLIIGCSTGYAAAVASRLASTVVALEADADLARLATKTLQETTVDNAIVMNGPHEAGWPAQAPYDVILLDGAVSEVPPALFEQLSEGGRLMAVTAGTGSMGEARLYKKIGSAISGRSLFDAAIRPLPGFARKPVFQF